MIKVRQIRDVARYVKWVNTYPDITGYSTYFDAYVDQFEPEVKEKQFDLKSYEGTQ